MIINLAEPASNAALDAIGRLLDGGSIELLSQNGGVLVTMRLATPATQAAADGELLFTTISEGTAAATGEARYGRLLTRNGAEVLSCDAGPEQSDAVIRLTPVLLTRNAPVRLQSFRLAMP